SPPLDLARAPANSLLEPAVASLRSLHPLRRHRECASRLGALQQREVLEMPVVIVFLVSRYVSRLLFHKMLVMCASLGYSARCRDANPLKEERWRKKRNPYCWAGSELPRL